MKDDQIEDLKQFIATTIRNEVQSATADLASKSDVTALRDEMNAGFVGIGDAIDNHTIQADKRIDKVEARLNALEAA